MLNSDSKCGKYAFCINFGVIKWFSHYFVYTSIEDLSCASWEFLWTRFKFSYGLEWKLFPTFDSILNCSFFLETYTNFKLVNVFGLLFLQLAAGFPPYYLHKSIANQSDIHVIHIVFQKVKYNKNENEHEFHRILLASFDSLFQANIYSLYFKNKLILECKIQ